MAEFEILPGLPPYGPLPEQFSSTGMGMHSEGFVVRFFPPTGEDWVGNFQPGLTNCSTVIKHPNGHWLVVISGGKAYVVDPGIRNSIREFGGKIQDVLPIPELPAIVFGNGCCFKAVGQTGELWTSRRISWDGMRSLQVEHTTLQGEAYNPRTDRWFPFSLDLVSGQAEGGSYSGPDDHLIKRRPGQKPSFVEKVGHFLRRLF